VLGASFEIKYKLLILALSCRFRFLLLLYAGLFVMFSLTKLSEDTGSCALTLETTKSTIERLVFFYSNFCHLYPSLRIMQRGCINLSIIVTHIDRIVNTKLKYFQNKFISQQC